MAKQEMASASSHTALADTKNEQEALKEYLGGLDEKCPFDFITIPTIPKEGAITFQKYTQQLDDDGKGILHLTARMKGGTIRLYDDEYTAILKYVKEHAIFWESRGDSNRVVVVPADGAGSKRSRRDLAENRLEPLSKYVFLSPMAEQRSPGYRPQPLG